MRRWKAVGGDPDLVLEVALWSVLAGLVGARLYHDVTSWNQVGDQWYGPIAIWQGGLGIWGGVLFGVRARGLRHAPPGRERASMMDAAAPGILVAPGHRAARQLLQPGALRRPLRPAVGPGGGPPAPSREVHSDPTFHPTFLYEMLWNFGGAALIIWLGHRFRLRPPGVFCLYVAIYSLGRIFWEQLRVDPSKMFLGQRLNFYVALALFLGAIVAFVWSVRRGPETRRRPARRAAAHAGREAPPAGSPSGASGRRATPHGQAAARAQGDLRTQLQGDGRRSPPGARGGRSSRAAAAPSTAARGGADALARARAERDVGVAVGGAAPVRPALRREASGSGQKRSSRCGG